MNPTNCTDLQKCVGDLTAEAISNDLPAFQSYLESSPVIEDSTNFDQCSQAREYFGFQGSYINDVNVCGEIEQLKYTNDFGFLDRFFGQGAEEDVPSLATADEFSLTPINRSGTQSKVVQNGVKWRATNFALTTTLEFLTNVRDASVDVECMADLTGMVQSICAMAQNLVYFTLFAVVSVLSMVSKILSHSVL